MSAIDTTATQSFRRRLDELHQALSSLERHDEELDRWGRALAEMFTRGGKLLVVGNGGSAALAAHLTAELVGRFDAERSALRAIWLGADQAALTALMNDYGLDEVFARQVDAYARPGDVLVAMSTSGRSEHVLSAARRARRRGAECWALTGGLPNPLAAIADRSITVPGRTVVVQEVHQVAVHMVCERLDAAVHVELHAGRPVDGSSRRQGTVLVDRDGGSVTT